MKKGRRTYGAIYTLPDGQRCYLAHRKISEIFRSGEKTISDAVRKGTAAWAIDEETLLQMRAQGIKLVGVMVRETGDKFLTQIEHWFDRSKAKTMNYSSRGGALQRYLPLTHFRHRPGKVKV